MSLISLIFTLFLVANPLGNSPAILALVKDFPFEQQIRILFRESVFAMLLALFFQMFGEVFLTALQIQNYTVSLCGGLLLFLVSLGMIFPKPPSEQTALKEPPFIVPIATPLISGAGSLTIIMLLSKEEPSYLKLFLAIVIAWTMIGAVLTLSPYLQKLLRRRGMFALEQLMGMLLAFMGIEMIRTGILQFKSIL